ncbi:hypothetical protein I8748_00055 [Nostoc sp. CENA67]|uniref:Uncharacterized protein n=1 Tax=Amazonocrinis nigriterrae CENA67 TaxID=2794033 RepID=A0A8J7HNS1_9NOST|nr:hypothetical protein [Amazonocrinis nigriterrae]MBH8560615.1 hypothetical protein [Amazonocrinis nigriterrae CENA67]
MAQIQLWTNSNNIVLPVTLGNGQKINMNVKANEAFYDDSGYVQIFSMRFNNGEYGNFKLLPNNQKADQALRFCKDVLAPFGLTIIGGMIMEGETVIDNLARHLFKHGSSVLIDNIFEQYTIKNSSYYAIDNGERVITHPVKLQLK